MKIVIINGQGGSGKDTFVGFCQEGLKDVWNISTIDYVKKLAFSVGWDGQKDDKGRKLLSDLKDALTEYGDIPFNVIIDNVHAIRYNYQMTHEDEDKAVVFIHCREPKEIDKLKKALNGTTLLIRRPTVLDTFTNHADKNVFDYDYDYVYDNVKDMDSFREDAIGFVNFLRRLKK